MNKKRGDERQRERELAREIKQAHDKAKVELMADGRVVIVNRRLSVPFYTATWDQIDALRSTGDYY